MPEKLLDVMQRQAIADARKYSGESMLGPWDLQQDGTVSRSGQLALEFPGETRLDDMIAGALNQQRGWQWALCVGDGGDAARYAIGALRGDRPVGRQHLAR